jgi:hypothetical protein
MADAARSLTSVALSAGRLMADEVPKFYCRAWSGFSSRWIAYVDRRWQEITFTTLYIACL